MAHFQRFFRGRQCRDDGPVASGELGLDEKAARESQLDADRPRMLTHQSSIKLDRSAHRGISPPPWKSAARGLSPRLDCVGMRQAAPASEDRPLSASQEFHAEPPERYRPRTDGVLMLQLTLDRGQEIQRIHEPSHRRGVAGAATVGRLKLVRSPLGRFGCRTETCRKWSYAHPEIQEGGLRAPSGRRHRPWVLTQELLAELQYVMMQRQTVVQFSSHQLDARDISERPG